MPTLLTKELNLSDPSNNSGCEKSNRIVAAATKINYVLNGRQGEIILVGVRHWDMLMHRMCDHLDPQIRELIMHHKNELVQTQGFVDRYGVFQNRRDALVVARTANQIIDERNLERGELYSENVW